MYGRRLERWSSAFEWPLVASALLFFVAFAIQIVEKPTGSLAIALESVIWGTWAVFVIDYVVRLSLAQRKWRWFSRHLLDLAIVVLPMIGPLRLMRFLTVIVIVHRTAGNVLRGRVAIYTVGAALITIVVAALAVLDVEDGVGNIDTFGDALWWAFVTMTTVGYGDFYPVTIPGRLVAAGLMVCGIALIGVVTATIASWIVERISADTTTAAAATVEEVDLLREELSEVRALIDEQDRSGESTRG